MKKASSGYQSETAEVRKLHRTLVRELGLVRASERKRGGFLAESHILLELDQSGRLSVSDLASAILVGQSVASRLVKRLREHGLVEAAINPEDERSKQVALTDAGRAFVKSVHAKVNDRVRDALGILTDKERQQVVHGLRLYVDALAASRKHLSYMNDA